MIKAYFYFFLSAVWLFLCTYGVLFIDEYFGMSEMSAIVNNIALVIWCFFSFGGLIMLLWIGIFDIELRSIPKRIRNFSITAVFVSLKELPTTLRVWTPIVLTYIVAPLVLVTYIGAWVFPIFPIWAIGNWIFTEHWAKKREHMPMLDNSEALGLIIFLLVPTFLSFIGTLIYYLVVVNEYTSNIIL
jgi:hypothetical protein